MIHIEATGGLKKDRELAEDVMTPVFKQIKGLLKKKVTSPIAKQWVMQQMKDRGITKVPNGFYSFFQFSIISRTYTLRFLLTYLTECGSISIDDGERNEY